MQVLLFCSDLIIPLVIFYIIGYGLFMKSSIYEDFVEGAGEGLKTVIGILPTLVGLIVSTGILRASGFLDMVSENVGKVTGKIGFPPELVPLSIVRLFSSGAATGLLLDIYKQFGTDSRAGLTASVMMCCTETVFYTMSVYFMAAKVTKTRYTLAGALLATAAGIWASVLLAGML